MFKDYPEILTIEMLRKMLSMSKSQIYGMCSTRSQQRMAPNNLPVLRINGNTRFLKSQIIDWLDKIVSEGRTTAP